MEVDPPKDTPEVVITPSDEMSVEAAQDKAEPGKTRRGKRSASPTLEQEPKPKRSSLSKVKRRSSFVRGRISNVHGGIVSSGSTDLLKDLPSNLSADKKLQHLTLSALEYTIGKLAEEFPEVDGLQQFEFKVRDAVKGKVEEMMKDGIYGRAVESSIQATDPLSVAIAQARSDCKKLETEVTRWEDLLDKRREEAHKAKTAASEVHLNPITAPCTFLPESGDGQEVDYQAVLNGCTTARQEMELFADEFERGVTNLRAFLAYSTGYLQHQARHIRQTSFQTLMDMDNPKNIISNLVR